MAPRPRLVTTMLGAFLARIRPHCERTAPLGKSSLEAAPIARQHFVLDGTNIALLHGPTRPELRYVLALAHYLWERGDQVSCFFDANTLYLFRDARSEQQDCFSRLTRESPWDENFVVVPSGTQADQWILELAKRETAEVISNDRFKDRAKNHRWIWKRRHGLSVVDGRLLISSLDACIELLPQPEDYFLVLKNLPTSANST